VYVINQSWIYNQFLDTSPCIGSHVDIPMVILSAAVFANWTHQAFRCLMDQLIVCPCHFCMIMVTSIAVIFRHKLSYWFTDSVFRDNLVTLKRLPWREICSESYDMGDGPSGFIRLSATQCCKPRTFLSSGQGHSILVHYSPVALHLATCYTCLHRNKCKVKLSLCLTN
jgi:hypothetical protein